MNGWVPRRRRSGLTLIELLVVTIVLATLVAMLSRAVFSARQSAARVLCQNHLRQWGLATAAYVAARQHYPPAATWRVDRSGASAEDLPAAASLVAARQLLPARHSVFTYLLPYVDQVSLGARIHLNLDWNAPQNDAWTHQSLSGIFLCPSAPGERSDKHPTDYTMAVRVDPSEPDGLGALLRQKAIRNRTADGPPLWGRGRPEWDGLLQLDQADYVRRFIDRRRVFPKDLRDGSSYTTLFFENAGKPLCYRYGRRSDCQITRFRWASSNIWLVLNDVCRGGQLLNCHNNSQPFGFHPGGVLAVYADGAVHFWPTEWDADLLVAAITLAGAD